jgi:bifunctional non-homologous end joining protein LigD
VRGVGSGKATPFPGFIEFCHPLQRSRPPSGQQWMHEVKLDGYRAELAIERGTIKVYSRRALDWSNLQFKSIAKAATFLRAHDCIIDGEVVAINSAGRPDFNLLRKEVGKANSPRLQFHAFDLLYLDGHDLRSRTLEARKQALRGLLRRAPEQIVFVDEFDAEGHRLFEEACKLGLEGIVSKQRGSPYRSGEQSSWVKVKCKATEAYPIIAFVEKLGAKPRRIASLYVGRWNGTDLVYAGKVRTGYTEALAREVRERLAPLVVEKPPLSHAIKKPKATWVKPELLAEVQYGSINEGGILREAVFKGLRDDLVLPQATVPRSAQRRTPGVSRQNILQLLPDAVSPSKNELASYWKRIWRKALPHLEHRPLKLVRHVHGTTFYHKGQLPELPKAVHQLKVQKREGGVGTRVWIDSLAGLLGLVEIGAVELHPWNSTVDDIERADRFVIDLDPGEDVGWAFVVETALTARDLLKSEGFRPWPKLSGGSGIHLMVPLEESVTHDAARMIARNIVGRLAASAPRHYTLSAAPGERHQRIYLDYLRNGRGNTAVGSYSPRVRQGFPIAKPVTWNDVERHVRPDAFSMAKP